MKIAILIPCLNEEKTIENVVCSFQNELHEAEIYMYDNNSSDNTYNIAKAAGAIVSKETKKGKANVILRMFNEIDADIYIMVDGDDTYSASDAKKLIEKSIDCKADMIVGDRLSNNSYSLENKRKFHEFGNKFIRNLINWFFNSNFKDILSGYRVFSRRFVKNYPSMVSGFELETDLTIFALHYNFNIIEVPINYKDRPKGSSSKLNTFKDGFKVIRTFFNLYRLYKPFDFFSLVSLVLIFMGLVIGFFPIMEYIEYQYVYKVPSAILAVAFAISSLLLFCCGLILDTIVKIDKKEFKHKLIQYDNFPK